MDIETLYDLYYELEKLKQEIIIEQFKIEEKIKEILNS